MNWHIVQQKGVRENRGHLTGPSSNKALIMISPPSAREEGTISRRLEHKSLISKPLESKTRFFAVFGGMGGRASSAARS